MSKRRAPFLQEDIQFYDLEKGQTDTLFVRLKSNTDKVVGTYQTFINAEAFDK